MAGGCLLIELHEVPDAQAVDVGIVGDALLGKVFAQIGAVGAYLLGQLCHRNVVLQIKLRLLAVLFQRRLNVFAIAVDAALPGSLLLLRFSFLLPRSNLAQVAQRLHAP